MNKKSLRSLLTGIMLIFIFSFIQSSCATSKKSRIATQRQGFMIQDKSEYATNRGKFKGSSSFKKQKRRSKRLKKNRKRM